MKHHPFLILALISQALSLYQVRPEDKQSKVTYACLHLHYKGSSSRIGQFIICRIVHSSLQEFFARRGLPVTLISDNAKTFKSASKDIKKLLRTPRLTEYFTLKGVNWRFIPELSPFQGGVWERLVRSTKHCLVKVIGRAYFSYEELATILTEIESVINSRPLTYIYDDSDRISYPLMPSQ